jgi:hypothetical protein
MRLALLLACALAAGPGPGSGTSHSLAPATTDICAAAPAGLPAPGGR